MKRVMAYLGFSAAVTLFAVNLMPLRLVYLTAGALCLLLSVSLALPHFRKAGVAPLCLGAAVFACLLFLTVYNGTVKPVQTLSRKTENVVLHTVTYPEHRNGKYIYTAVVDSVEEDGVPQGIKIHLTSKEPLSADVYQYVNASVRFSRCGTDAFNAYGYWGKGIFLYGSVQVYRATHDYVKTPLRWIVHLRRDIVETLTAAIGGDNGALAAAMLTGDKSRLSAKAYADFKRSGMTHIMAVSGLHLSVLCGMLLLLMKLLRINNHSAAVTVLMAIVFYAALSGFSKSVIRAGVMVGIMMLSVLAERKGDALNSLGAAVFLICLNPFAVSDVSAVLSVLSVLSLITVYPRLLSALYKVLHFRPAVHSLRRMLWHRPIDYVLRSIAASFCVLVGTLPAGVLFFDGVALSSLFANVAVIPLGSAQVVLSLLTYLCHKAGVLSALLTVCSHTVTGLILKIVEAAASTGLGVTFGRYFALAVGICLLLTAVCFLAAKKEWLKPAAVCCVLIICVTVAAEEISYQHSAHVYLFDGCGVVVCDGKTAVWGVNDRSDYLELSSLLGNRREPIDLMLCENTHNPYAIQLAEELGCLTAVTPDLSGGAPSFPASFVNRTAAFRTSLSDFLEVTYATDNQGEWMYNIKIKGYTISNRVGVAADITVTDGIVTDGKGQITISRSTVIYDISNNDYTARRADAWQS